jgi:23S rRNA (cytidine2498-2'-O)-methyltransferase
MDARVLTNPRFTHLRMRGAEVRKREFRKVRWLVADINVAPEYTLDTVESIVSHRETNIRGVIMMLKLLDWSLAAEIENYMSRVHEWGFPRVLVRQLHHNRQEICLAAMKEHTRGTRRPSRT